MAHPWIQISRVSQLRYRSSHLNMSYSQQINSKYNISIQSQCTDNIIVSFSI